MLFLLAGALWISIRSPGLLEDFSGLSHPEVAAIVAITFTWLSWTLSGLSKPAISPPLPTLTTHLHSGTSDLDRCTRPRGGTGRRGRTRAGAVAVVYVPAAHQQAEAYLSEGRRRRARV